MRAYILRGEEKKKQEKVYCRKIQYFTFQKYTYIWINKNRSVVCSFLIKFNSVYIDFPSFIFLFFFLSPGHSQHIPNYKCVYKFYYMSRIQKFCKTYSITHALTTKCIETISEWIERSKKKKMMMMKDEYLPILLRKNVV